MRQFKFGELIPDDVARVEAPDGDEYVRAENGLFKLSAEEDGAPGYLSALTSKSGPKPLVACWFDFEFPLTEIEVEA
jgi:hypothetical protein